MYILNILFLEARQELRIITYATCRAHISTSRASTTCSSVPAQLIPALLAIQLTLSPRHCHTHETSASTCMHSDSLATRLSSRRTPEAGAIGELRRQRRGGCGETREGAAIGAVHVSQHARHALTVLDRERQEAYQTEVLHDLGQCRRTHVAVFGERGEQCRRTQ